MDHHRLVSDLACIHNSRVPSRDIFPYRRQSDRHRMAFYIRLLDHKNQRKELWGPESKISGSRCAGRLLVSCYRLGDHRNWMADLLLGQQTIAPMCVNSRQFLPTRRPRPKRSLLSCGSKAPPLNHSRANGGCGLRTCIGTQGQRRSIPTCSGGHSHRMGTAPISNRMCGSGSARKLIRRRVASARAARAKQGRCIIAVIGPASCQARTDLSSSPCATTATRLWISTRTKRCVAIWKRSACSGSCSSERANGLLQIGDHTAN